MNEWRADRRPLLIRDGIWHRLRASFLRERLSFLSALALVIIVTAFLLVPVGKAISSGFYIDGQLTTYWLQRIATSPILSAELGNTLVLATITTLVCIAISLPLAVIRDRYQFRGSNILAVMLLIPLILPPFVGAIAVKRFMGQFGVFNLMLDEIGIIDMSKEIPTDWLGSGFVGVVILQSLHLFPILYLNISAALANVDPTYRQAARNLGASPFQTFFRVTFPLIRPGLFAGGTIVFIWAFTDVGTPAIIGYEHLTPVTIFKELSNAEVNPRTYSLVFVMLSTSIAFYLAGKFMFGRASAGQSSKATTTTEVARLGIVGTLGAWLLFGIVIFFSVLPHVGVVLMGISDHWINTILPTSYTTRHLVYVLEGADTMGSIVNSLQYAGVATVVDILLGSLAAWVVVRSRIYGRTALDSLCMLPLAVPGLILAAGYVALTAPGTRLEAFGPTQNPFVILCVAYSIRRLPFVLRGVSAGLQQIPESMEEAARNLGASRFMTTMRITLPLISANIIAASVLTFSFHMLEVGDSLILAQTADYYPITKQIYRLAVSTGSPDATSQAAAMGVYGIALLGVTMGTASMLLGRRLGMVFRA